MPKTGILLYCLALLLTWNAAAGGADMIDLGAYQWKHRLVLLFASSPDDPAYRSFIRQVENREKEIKERDVLLIHVFENGRVLADTDSFSETSSRSLRKTFSVKPGEFTVVLIGKDGGEKLRQTGTIRLDGIFVRIDTMPMRQQEMREQKNEVYIVDTLTQIYLPNLAAVLAMMFLAWLISLPKKDVSIIDIFWGLGFVLIAWLTFLKSDGYIGRKVLIVTLVTLWGIRLAAYIFLRGRGKGEDPRYTAMRAKHGERFRLVSLYKIFALQAFLCWVISLVVQVGQVCPSPAKFTGMDALGALIWVTGFFFESVGDWQLARFKADPANRGKVMDRGLWALSRHPNYFGESLMWWGLYGIALSTPGSAWAIISPAVITFLLLKVSGVTLLEKTIVETRPQYRDYIQRTSAFIPWFPKRQS